MALLGAATAAQDDDAWRQEPEFRRIEAALLSGDNTYFGSRERDALQAVVDDPATSEADRLNAKFKLARQLLKAGEVDRSLEYMEECYAALRGDRAKRPRMLSSLALGYLRKAETANCVERHNAECCIFPLEGGAVHSERAPAERARELYLEILERRPEDLEARWLANVAAMALGEYPSGLPEAAVIPPKAFASEGPAPRFRDVAPDLGVDAFNLCGGAVLEDFDRNGYLDILTSSYDPGEPLRLFLSGGDGTYADASAASHANDQLGGLNLIAADYDGDGDKDALVLRGAWLADEGRIRNSLLRNDDGVFVDVTRAAGIDVQAAPTQAAAWGDFDADGALDLFVPNESTRIAGGAEEGGPGDYPDQLFLNRGDGTFREAAREWGIVGNGFTKGVTAGDYDNDGDLDLFLSNIGPNQLFRNDGERFTEVAAAAGVVEPSLRSFACWFFDYDNDGWLDLFVAAYDATVADIAAYALGVEQFSTPPRLYVNQRDGTFVDAAERLGLARPFKPMGANFGDVDNDGFLDVYLTTGEPMLQSLMPNVLLRNDGGERFLDVTTAAGLGHLQKGHGIGFGDLDQDGDQDLYHQLGGFYPVDRYANALFENPGSPNAWIQLELVGTTCNRDAYGARVRVVLEGGGRELHRAVGSVSSFGGSPLRQEIGLGALDEGERIARVEIVWPPPSKRAPQVFEDVAPNATYRVVEGAEELERIELAPAPFARRSTPAGDADDD